MSYGADSDDPRQAALLARLDAALHGLMHGALVNGSLLREIEDAVDYAESVATAQRIKLPKLTVFLLPAQRECGVYLRDLPLDGIKMVIVNMTKKYPRVTPEEIAWAVGRAWPQYRSGIVNVEARSKHVQPAPDHR